MAKFASVEYPLIKKQKTISFLVSLDLEKKKFSFNEIIIFKTKLGIAVFETKFLFWNQKNNRYKNIRSSRRKISASLVLCQWLFISVKMLAVRLSHSSQR